MALHPYSLSDRKSAPASSTIHLQIHPEPHIPMKGLRLHVYYVQRRLNTSFLGNHSSYNSHGIVTIQDQRLASWAVVLTA
eukprot:1349761-Pyramimonas_sp.AAC.1